MVRPDIGYHVVRRIHAQLGEVVQLPGLAGFYADTCIGVRRAVVRLVAGVLAPLVPRTGALVLVLRPPPITAFDGIEFLLVGAHAPLSPVGPVALGLPVRLLFVHCANGPDLARELFVQVLFRYFQFQGIHTGIGLHGGRIDGLGMAAHHTLFHAHDQHFCEDFLEHRFREQLPRTAYGTVPRQLLVDIVTYEEKDVQA